jgi:hypothetical protein
MMSQIKAQQTPHCQFERVEIMKIRIVKNEISKKCVAW